MFSSWKKAIEKFSLSINKVGHRLGLRRCNITPNHAVFCGQNITLIVSKVGKCGMKIILSKFALDLDSSSYFHDQIGRSVH